MMIIFSFIVSDDFESNEDPEDSLLNEFKEKIDKLEEEVESDMRKDRNVSDELEYMIQAFLTVSLYY